MLHQARHRTAGHAGAFAQQLPPDFAHAIDTEVLLEDALDLRFQGDIVFCPRRALRWIETSGRMGMIGRRGDGQDPAERLDPVDPTMIVDEGDHGLNRRYSGSARYADASRNLLAGRSSRFSRSVSPDRRPFSRPAF
jgi:hypothetical protein